MRWVCLTLAAAIVLPSCEPPQSAADCRRRARAARVSRALGSRQDATADALENIRCDDLARDERAEQATSEQERQSDAAQLAEIRRSPKRPEIGATRAESEVICRNERGTWSEQADVVGCLVGGAWVFSCRLTGEQTSTCTTFFEGADLPTIRDQLAQKIGAPEGEAISPKGFRVYFWAHRTVMLTMDARSVQLTLFRPKHDMTEGSTSDDSTAAADGGEE